MVLGTNRLGTPAHSAWVKRWSSFALAVVRDHRDDGGRRWTCTGQSEGGREPHGSGLEGARVRGMTSSFSATYPLSAAGFVTATMTVAHKRSKLTATGWPSAGWMYRFTVRSPKAWLVGAEWDEIPWEGLRVRGEVRRSALGVCRAHSARRPWKYRYGVGERNVRAVRGGEPCRDPLA